MKAVTIFEQTNGFSTLAFFNSKEVYSIKGFDTKRKALNYAKKYGYEIYSKLPEGITMDLNG